MKLALSATLAGVIGSLIIFAVIVGPLVGAFSGWIVGWIFDETFLSFLSWIGWDVHPWQFGLMLGFIAGFMKTTVNSDD